MRFDLLRQAFLNEADAALIVSEINRLYFTGFASSDGFLLITADKAVFFTDSRYIEAVQNRITSCDEVVLFRTLEKSVKPVLQSLGIRSIMTESDRLTVSDFRSLKEKLSVEVISDGTLDKEIDRLRSVKTEEEVEKIKKAQRIGEEAFRHILSFLESGRTEKEVALELDYFMLSHGADGISFETIAVSGANSSMPHGVPSDKKLMPGDFLTMDFGAVVDGYHSDMTRTVAIGRVSDAQKEVYEVVLAAQKAGFEAIAPGVEGKKADEEARRIIENAGYGKYFGHSLGHGVGLEIHEKPNLSPSSQSLLEKGNIVTVEPGIYLPGRFGVRIEDMVRLTEDGKENLTDCDKTLIVV